ncbi:ATP-binding protein [Hydrogenophaga sp.]|uniref:sensor histidine kinase n=1 Tax=Hydrogenophaga sp. TaxID=1904254 RepID=UPI0035B143E2
MLEAQDELDDLTSWLLILERIVEQSANMVVITDADQRIRWVNQTYSKVTGWSLEEARGQKAGHLLRGPATDVSTAQAIGHPLRGGLSVSGVEMTNYRKCGDPYTVLLNIEPIRNTGGKVVAYFSIQSDVTDRRVLEHRNRELQHHLQEAQKLARLGRIDFNPDTRLLRWSPEVFDILELAPGQIRQGFRELLGFVAEEAQEELRQRIADALAEGTVFDHEFPILTSQGHRRWVRCRGMPERHVTSFRPPGTWTIQDVTVYRELIEQKRLTNERLKEMVADRTRHLEEANRSLEAFSHGLSHDLKKPIRHMVSYSEIARSAMSEGDLDAARHYSAKVVAAGLRLQSVIDGMLAFSRLGRGALHPSRIDLALRMPEWLEETASSFSTQPYEVIGIERLPTVWADPVLIQEVWCNLMDNAFKYSGMREVTRLEWNACPLDDGWTVSLRDNGCGFDASEQAHVFEMFGRLKNPTNIEGDGIGLALCRRIVQSHDGRIWAESTPEHGSVFHVWLPCEGAKSAVRPLRQDGQAAFNGPQTKLPGHRLSHAHHEP